MSLLDLLAIAVILLLAIRGIRRGLVGETIETIGTVGAAYLTYRFYPAVANLLGLPTTGSLFVLIGGFIAAFFVIIVALTIVGLLFRGLLRKLKLGPIDKVLGFALGLIKGTIVMVAITGCLNWVGGEPRRLVERSPVARTLLSVSQRVLPLEDIKSPDEASLPTGPTGDQLL